MRKKTVANERRVAFRIPPVLDLWVRERAAANGMTASQVVRQIIRFAMSEDFLAVHERGRS